MAQDLIDEDSDDDFPSLSTATLLALQEFRNEQSALASRFESLQSAALPQSSLTISSKPPLDIKTIPENWALSQFWYSTATASTFANALLHDATSRSHIACVCAPSVFVQLKNILSSPPYLDSPETTPRICLLDFDRRFEVLASTCIDDEEESEFIPYDFKDPLRRLPNWLHGWADRVVVDPPFLSHECHTAVAETAKWLLDAPSGSVSNGGVVKGSENGETPKIIVCTGAIMEDLVLAQYTDAGGGMAMRRTTYEAVHEGGRLSNEWGTFANFEGEWWRFV